MRRGKNRGAYRNSNSSFSCSREAQFSQSRPMFTSSRGPAFVNTPAMKAMSDSLVNAIDFQMMKGDRVLATGPYPAFDESVKNILKVINTFKTTTKSSLVGG